MISYADALDTVMASVKPLATEAVALKDACGSVLAATATAAWDLPSHDISAMDGYAFLFSGQQSGDTLPAERAIMAGDERGAPLPNGHAVRIMTGAALPDGCDTVVPVEDLDVTEGSITLLKPVNEWQHVRPRGEEMVCGKEILPAGTFLSPAEIGLLAAAGVARPTVIRKPKVAILATGDELVTLEEEPSLQKSQRINSSAYHLASRLREVGFEVVPLGIAGDQVEVLEGLVRKGLSEADLLITTGGVSVGDRDLVQEVLLGMGLQVGFWKAAIKPGKPILFGMIDDKPMFGLPGNPAATAMTLETFVLPALRQLAGHAEPRPRRMKVTLTARVKGGGRRQNFLWGRVDVTDDGLAFTPSDCQISGQHRSMVGCNALLPVAITVPEYVAGNVVEVILFRGL